MSDLHGLLLLTTLIILWYMGILQGILIAVFMFVFIIILLMLVCWLIKDTYHEACYRRSGQAKADRELNEAREAEYRKHWEHYQATHRRGTKWNEFEHTYESKRAEYFEKKGWKPNDLRSYLASRRREEASSEE